MPVTVIERVESRKGTVGEQPGAELSFLVDGTEDDAQVRSAIDGTIPLYYGNMPFANYVYTHLGGGVWEATVRYGPRFQDRTGRGGYDPASPSRPQGYPSPPTQQAGDAGSVSFDTTGGQEKVYQSLRTSRNSAVGEALPPDLKGAVNWNFQGGKSDGIEITVPKMVYEETWVWPIGVISGAYITTLFELTGTTNAYDWHGFREQDVLFLGATGSQRGRDDFEIRYKFQMSLSRENFLVGDVLVTLKRGWEYMWVKYTEKSVGGEILPVPSGAYVEQVYPTADFTLLGIGG